MPQSLVSLTISEMAWINWNTKKFCAASLLDAAENSGNQVSLTIAYRLIVVFLLLALFRTYEAIFKGGLNDPNYLVLLQFIDKIQK